MRVRALEAVESAIDSLVAGPLGARPRLDRPAAALDAARRSAARARLKAELGALGPDGVLTTDPDGRPVFITGSGQALGNLHRRGQCAGENCVIHNPSDHIMRGFPTYWRGDRGIMERTCPHGVGHPDPDDMAFHDRVNPGHVEGVHGCDGCCTGSRFTE